MDSRALRESPCARIKYLMDIFGFSSDYAMSRATGLDRSTIRNIINRDRIGPKAAGAIAKVFDISATWVESGFGPMRPDGTPAPESAIWDSSPSAPTEQAPGSQFAAPASTQQDIGEFVLIRKTKAKLSDEGGLMPDDSWIGEPYAFRRSWLKRVATSLNNVVLVEIEGDSMSPTLQNRNMALIDLGRRDFKPGKLFAIRLGDIIQIKRLDIGPEGVVLIYSDSPLYKPLECHFENLHIIGQLIWSARTWV